MKTATGMWLDLPFRVWMRQIRLQLSSLLLDCYLVIDSSTSHSDIARTGVASKSKAASLPVKICVTKAEM